MAQFRFGPKNSKKFLQYLLTIRSQFHTKRTTLIPTIHPEHIFEKWKLYRFYAVFLRKKPMKDIQKNTYIGFWGFWLLISNPGSVAHRHHLQVPWLQSHVTSTVKSCHIMNEENSLGSMFFQLYRGRNFFELALSWLWLDIELLNEPLGIQRSQKLINMFF